MRDHVVLYVNGERHEVRGAQALMQLGDWLRYIRHLTGTKIVCAEGDCGACTVLVSRLEKGRLARYQAINSCIGFVWLFDRCHIITVEGLKRGDEYHPVQKSMVAHHGAQCGYCTPGFVCAMAGMTEDARSGKFPLDDRHVKNALTGNLCRCTGYESIITAGKDVDLTQLAPLREFYQDTQIEADLAQIPSEAVRVQAPDREAYLPSNLIEASRASADHRLVAGATDLGVLSNKGKFAPKKLMSLQSIQALHEVHEDDRSLLIGAKVNLDQVERACAGSFPEFSRLLRVFASPQIKHAGTLVGNLVNASPIADTIPFLRVAEAEVVLLGPEGERMVNINRFYKGGYKELDLLPGEIVTLVRLPKRGGHFKLYKVSKRKDMDISCVTFAAHYKLIGDEISEIALAYGGVGPTVLRLPQLEQMAQGQSISEALFRKMASELKHCFRPLGDVRGSDAYRMVLCQNLMMKFYDELRAQAGAAQVEASV